MMQKARDMGPNKCPWGTLVCNRCPQQWPKQNDGTGGGSCPTYTNWIPIKAGAVHHLSLNPSA